MWPAGRAYQTSRQLLSPLQNLSPMLHPQPGAPQMSCTPVSSMVLVAGLAAIMVVVAAAGGTGWSAALGPPADPAAGCAARSGLVWAAARCLFVSGVYRCIGMTCLPEPYFWSKHTSTELKPVQDITAGRSHLLLFKEVHGVQLVVWRKADAPPHALAVSLALLC